MNGKNEDFFSELKKSIFQQKKILREITSAKKDLKNKDVEEEMVYSHINSLKEALRYENKNILNILEKVNYPKNLSEISNKNKEKDNFAERFSHKEKTAKSEKKASVYVRFANKIFAGYSNSLIEKGFFPSMDRDLEKANMDFLPKNYVSIIIFTTLLSVIFAVFLTFFLIFFNLSFIFPFISRVQEEIGIRILKVIWIFFVLPIATFFFMYSYPSLERKSLEGKINQELPFATINMAAISGSLIDPTKIFSIIISTKEYPALEKEFTKVINGVNILGYDLVTTLRKNAFNNPSKKLTELFNGLATTINSGGDLPKFFDERAKTLLFEYKLDREKSIRAAETFMDIYISVVIAAPMILMLLLIIIQISGIGISLSTSAITALIILAVTIVNVIFLTFLHARQAKE